MTLRHKSVPARLKSFDEDQGQAVFIAAVFDNVDAGNDRILKGAFTETLQKRKPKLQLDHRAEQQFKLGRVDDAYETEEGLVIEASFNLEKQVARETWSDLKFDPDSEFSIGYSVPSGGEKRVGAVNELSKIDLYEVSVVALAMNPSVRLIAAKSLLDSVRELEAEADELKETVVAETEEESEEEAVEEAVEEVTLSEEDAAKIESLRTQANELLVALEELLG